jgi:adenylate kinase
MKALLDSKMVIVLLGPPGAGKGTQAKQLERTLGIPQVATGDLFRHNLKNETELGKLAKSYMDRGELVPDEVTVAMAKARLSEPDCADGVILDGFPRNLAQVAALDSLLAELGKTVDIVPAIRVEQEVLVNRLLKRAQTEGRADDNEATIRTRMQVYEAETKPLLDYYRKKGLLVEIDGEQTVEQVQEDLLRAIRRAA